MESVALAKICVLLKIRIGTADLKESKISIDSSRLRLYVDTKFQASMESHGGVRAKVLDGTLEETEFELHGFGI